MAITYTTTDLYARVRRTCQLRAVNLKLTEAEVLQVCDEEIQQNLFPQLMTARDDYQMTNTVILLTAGILRYRVPFGASSSTIDHIAVVTISGSTALSQRPLDRLSAPEMMRFTGATGGVPVAYAIIGDDILIGPVPDATAASTQILVINHEYRPARLIEVSSCRLISSVTSTSPTVTLVLSSSISGTGLAANSLVDITPGLPPFMPFVTGATIASIAGDPTITVTPSYSVTVAQLAAQITTGSYLTPHGSTCVWPLPDAWWSAGILACAASVARTTAGSTNEQAGSLRADADAAIARCVQLQTSRVRKQPQKIFDRSSPLRTGGYGFPKGRY